LDCSVHAGERVHVLNAARAGLEAASRLGAVVLSPESEGYPPGLLELPDPPPYAFLLGHPRALDPPAVAIVGTRTATAYGVRATRRLATALARQGVSVVSGLARGIDAVAHRAALDVGGRTVAVLGTGVDVAYPAAHRGLHAEIVRRGAVLSEHLPGEPATAGSFPRRNRLIAALAHVTIVVEAGATSGALITAGHALDLGRTVAAVPGPIDAAQSAGSNELLRDGATVLCNESDALALFGLVANAPPAQPPGAPDERAVWLALADGALDLDALAARAQLPAARCLAAISALELSGVVECGLAGEVRLK
jgi:DNA processing protein